MISRPTSQHHKRLAWLILAGLFVGLLLIGRALFLPSGYDLWHQIAGAGTDGDWRFTKMDGYDVSSAGYAVSIEWGDVTAGHDGCNGWGYVGEAAAGSSLRMIVSDLQKCFKARFDGLYRRIALGDPSLQLAAESRLILTVPGHRAELVRKR